MADDRIRTLQEVEWLYEWRDADGSEPEKFLDEHDDSAILTAGDLAGKRSDTIRKGEAGELWRRVIPAPPEPDRPAGDHAFTLYARDVEILLDAVARGKAAEEPGRFTGASFDVDRDGNVTVHIAGIDPVKL